MKYRNTFESVSALFESWEWTYSAFKIGTCPLKPSQGDKVVYFNS